MRQASWLVGGAVALVACVDFDAARARCDEAGGRCAADGGVASSGGGAGSTGGGDAIASGGGPSGGGLGATGGGLGTTGGGLGTTGGGTGACAGCWYNSTCVLPPLSDSDQACGTRGAQCQNCTTAFPAKTCRAFACVTAPAWTWKYQLSTSRPLYAVWVSDGGDVWAAGPGGIVVHGSGGTFTEVYNDIIVYSLVGFTVDGRPSLVAAGTYSNIPRVQVLPIPWGGDPGEAGYSSTTLYGGFTDLYGAFVAGNRVYVAGGDGLRDRPGVWRHEDAGWADVTPDAGLSMVIAAWGAPGGEYYVTTTNQMLARVTASGVEHWPLPSIVNSMFGGTPPSVWLAGEGGFLARAQNGSLTQLDAGMDKTWSGVWAADDTHVFVVGRRLPSTAAIGEWDGVVWRVVLPASSSVFNAVSGRSANDVWAVDGAGSIWHLE